VNQVLLVVVGVILFLCFEIEFVVRTFDLFYCIHVIFEPHVFEELV